MKRETLMNDMAGPIDGSERALACVAGAIPAEVRPTHFERIARLFTMNRERLDLDDGLAFRFDGGLLIEVAEFVSWERLCCPFLRFTFDVRAGDGMLWLRLQGPPGTREFLAAELLGAAT